MVWGNYRQLGSYEKEYNYNHILHKRGSNGAKNKYKRVIIEEEEEKRHPSFEDD